MPATFARIQRDLLSEHLLRKSYYWDSEGRVDRLVDELPQPATETEIRAAIEQVAPGSDFCFVVSQDFIPSLVTDQSVEVLPDFEALEAFLGPTADAIRVSPDFEWLVHGDLIVLRPSTVEGSSDEDYGTDADVMGEYPTEAVRPLISHIAIENFKGIGDRVLIDLKPITLLFGPNSAGKSTILHALHYAREVFVRHNLDADQTAIGGKFVDLGGFKSFVHNRRQDAQVALEFGLDLEDRDMPAYLPFGGTQPVQLYEQADLSAAVQTASVRIRLGYSETLNDLYVSEYAVVINGRMLATITCSPDRRSIQLGEIDYRHPALPINEFFTSIADLADAERKAPDDPRPIIFSLFALEGQRDALPIFGKALRLATLAEPGLVEAATKEFAESVVYVLDAITAIFSQLMVGPGEIIREALSSITYLGPIREIPSRNHHPPKSPDPSRWSSGLAAWDILATCPNELVDRVSDWMQQRLSTGYRIERRQSMKIDMASPAMRALLSGRAFEEVESARIQWSDQPKVSEVFLVAEGRNLELAPCEVGIGLSQVLPVVVASLIDSNALTMIEQPELHVHPRIQADMGDLFIEGALVHSRPFIIETHSEHLALRLLRRVREHRFSREDISIVYVGQSGGATTVQAMRLDEEGDFVDGFPGGFFPERLRELR